MRRWIVIAICCILFLLPGVGHCYWPSDPLQLNIYNATDKPIVCKPGRQGVLVKLLHTSIDVFPPTTIMPHEFKVFQFYSATQYGLFERLLTRVPLVVDGHKVSLPLYSLDWPHIDNYLFYRGGSPGGHRVNRDCRFITVAPNRKIYYRAFDSHHPYYYPVPPTDWKQLEKCQPPQYPLTY